MTTADALSVGQKIERRAQLLDGFVSALAASAVRPRVGPLDIEIEEQRAAHDWERENPPLESGWYSTIQHLGAAEGHTAGFLSSLAQFRHVSTAALLARGSLESLSLILWLNQDDASVTERSLRSLADVRYSTTELKKLYREQGFQVDPPNLDERGRLVFDALSRIERDGRAAGGVVGSRPKFLDLIERYLLGRSMGDEQREKDASLYRFLSPLAHGTKWAVNHFSTPTDRGDMVNTRPTDEFIEMLLFYLGIGYLRVGAAGRRRLGWSDLLEHGAAEFLDLGPCELNLG